MDVVIYHNPRCGKSRETLALLEKKGLTPKVVEYLKTPPSAAELGQIVKMMGKPAHLLVRAKEAREAGIDPDKLSEGALLSALAKNPAVIERPIVVAGKKAALGRPPEAVLAIL